MNAAPDCAIVLAAGRGMRLKPLTNDVPKTLLHVARRPILSHIFDALHQGAGVRHFQIVAGYRATDFDEISAPLDCTLAKVLNESWESTGSLHSLGLCGDFLSRGCYVVEGDCCFDASLLRAAAPPGSSVWYGRRFHQEDDGCTLWPDVTNRVTRVTIEKKGGATAQAFKSCGVLRFTPHYGKAVLDWLGRETGRGHSYELVLRDHLNDLPIFLGDAGSAPWQEVDCPDDLARAETIFGPR